MRNARQSHKNCYSAVMRAILVGFGSIGKRHLQQLKKRCEEVVVVDPFVDVSQVDAASVQFFRSLDDYLISLRAEVNLSFVPSIAVIANWGPDHFSTFRELRKLGVAKFLIEKPLTSRLSDIEELEADILSDDIQVWTNFHLRFDTATRFIQKYIENKESGKPSLMTVSGGAKCLATTGIHWIDYFIFLSESREFELHAQIRSENINPRNAQLSFLEGFVHLHSPKSSVNLVFTNQSFADSLVEIYWKTFKVQILAGKLRVLESDNPNLSTYPVTRTSPFTKIAYEMDFGQSGLDNLYDSFFTSRGPMPDLLDANKYLLKALIHSDANVPNAIAKYAFFRDKDYLIS
jgi:hypothetical protein